MSKRKYDEAIEELEKLLVSEEEKFKALAEELDLDNEGYLRWDGNLAGIREAIHRLEVENTVTTLELAQAYTKPERLITERTPLLIREVYRINPTFHAIVTKHEAAGSNYKAALEETVVNLVSEIARRDIAANESGGVYTEKLTAWVNTGEERTSFTTNFLR